MNYPFKENVVSKTFFCAITIVSLFLPTAFTIAQTSNSVLRRYDPSVRISTSNGGTTFKGIKFSGVGAAVAGCADLGGKISGGIDSVSSIFKSKSSTQTPSTQGSNQNTIGTEHSDGISEAENPLNNILNGNNSSEEVPVIAEKTNEQLEKINQKESCLDGIATALMKDTLRQVTNRILNWANNGFGGDPLYVPNLESFLRRQSNTQIRQFLNTIPRQDPIFGNAIRSAVTYSVSGLQDGLLDIVMNTPEAQEYEAFQKDFSQGGWKSFLDPNKNAVGAFFSAVDDLGNNIAKEEQNTREELQRNNGFLDMKFCVEYAEKPKTQTYCEDLGPDDNYQDCVSRAEAQESSEPDCLEWETVTPGSVIASQVSEVTGSSIRQLEQADEINEVLGAFFDEALSNLLSKGLSSLGDKKNKSFKSTGLSYSGVNGVGVDTGASAGIDALGYTESRGTYRAVDFDISRPQYVRAVLQTQYDYLSTILDARIALNKIVPTLGALDYCIPGPNPTWKEGLSQSVNSFFNSLKPVTKENANTGATIGSAIGNAVGVIPGVGAVLGGLASALGGLIGGLFDRDPGLVLSSGLSFEDKVTNTTLPARPILFRKTGHSIELITNFTRSRTAELIQKYEQLFTYDKILQAFISVDPGNEQYIRGFLSNTYEETANLPAYANASLEIDTFYSENEQLARDAIVQLEAIHNEVNQIVGTAKARYIAQQAALGIPIDQSCIDDAYQISTTPITPRARQESSAPSPLFDQFIEANNYFYYNL